MKRFSTTLQQLFDSAHKGDADQVFHILSAHPELLNAADERENTVLMHACAGQHLELARDLVAAGADAFQKCWHWGNATHFLKDLRLQKGLQLYAFYLTPEGIATAKRERQERERENEYIERKLMKHEDMTLRQFYDEEWTLRAEESRLMRLEERYTKRMLQKAIQISIAIRKKLSANFCNNLIRSTVSGLITAHKKAVRAAKDAELVRRKKLERKKQRRAARKLAFLSGKSLSGKDSSSKLPPILQTSAPSISSKESKRPGSQETQQQTLPGIPGIPFYVPVASADSSDDDEEDEEEREARLYAERMEAARLEEERRQAREAEERAIREKAEAEQRLKCLREAERVARLEWNHMQADIRRKEKDAFEAAKPVRLTKYARCRLAATRI